MKRVAWPALMRLGIVEMGLTPAVFWDLTPAELFLLAGIGSAERPMDRAGLKTLMARFPDAARAVD